MSGWTCFLVGAGGAAGAALRYAVGRGFASRGAKPVYGTLAVNAAGSLAIGILAGMHWHDQHPALYDLLGIGVLGGLTTYSTLNVQKALLFREKDWRTLARYAAATYLGGWLLTGAGIWLGSVIRL